VLKVSRAFPVADSRDEDVRALVRALGDVITLVEPRLLELWKSTGITFAQRRVLRRLVSGPRSAGDLAAELGIAAPTLTRQLQKLEDRGLLDRRVDATDRRRVTVALTDAGARLLAGHRVLGGGPLVMAARNLSPGRRRDLADALRRLVELAREPEVAGRDD
jgi:DNA-binding MarR family transcriptional regulator